MTDMYSQPPLPEGPPGGVPTVVIRQGSSAWPWMLLVVLVMGVTCVGAPIGFLIWQLTRGVSAVMEAPTRLFDSAAHSVSDAMRTKIDVQSITTTALGSMRQQSKLVVLDTTVDADITKEEGLRSWGVYWGTNKVRLIARDNRVQYVIPLEGMGTADFVYDEPAKKLTVLVPRPRLDEEMVSVQSDPSKVIVREYAGGWARWDKDDTLKHAQEALRPAIIAQGKAEVVRREAERSGLEKIRNFLDPFISTIQKDGVTVTVEYHRE